jgi:hypothetical protein
MLELLRSRAGMPVDFRRCAAEVGILDPQSEVIKVHVCHARALLRPNERIVSSYGRRRGHSGTYTLLEGLDVTYTYVVSGTAAAGQTWETTGTVESNPGNFRVLSDVVMSGAFAQLTEGRAVFGFPGIGCRGPYSITKLVIERAES